MLSFQYTKDDGSVTDRVIVPLVKPSADYFGIDISELSEESQGIFADKISDILSTRDEAIHQLMSDFDLRFKFRNFKVYKMSNVVEE